MNVVIGDFEVLTEPAPAVADSAPPAQAETAPASGAPDILPQQVLALQLRDALRLWAQ